MSTMQIKINDVVLRDEEIVGSLVEILTIQDVTNPDDVGYVVIKILSPAKMIVQGSTGSKFTVKKSDVIKLYQRDPDHEGEFIGL